MVEGVVALMGKDFGDKEGMGVAANLVRSQKGKTRKQGFNPTPPTTGPRPYTASRNRGGEGREGKNGPPRGGGGEKPQKGESNQVRYPFMRTQK